MGEGLEYEIFGEVRESISNQQQFQYATQTIG